METAEVERSSLNGMKSDLNNLNHTFFRPFSMFWLGLPQKHTGFCLESRKSGMFSGEKLRFHTFSQYETERFAFPLTRYRPFDKM